MYYYIFDIKKCRKKTQVEAIKDHLTGLGISGEFTYVSAAQTAEELTELGLRKKYSTIVAVGGDDLINAVSNKMIGRPEAMGAIPLQASPSMINLLGTNTWQKAAESLRFRKIKEINIGRTATGKHFLTHIKLDIKNPLEVTLEFKNFIVQAVVKNLLVSNYHSKITKPYSDHLDVILEGGEENNILSKVITAFKTIPNKKNNISVFRARSLRIFTKRATPIIAGDIIISKTPQLIETTDNLLRLIVARKI